MKNRWWSSTSHLRRLWLMLALSLCFFVAQMIAAHVTHSLTLLSAAYQMLYNIFSLGGCIATIKVNTRTLTGEVGKHGRLKATKLFSTRADVPTCAQKPFQHVRMGSTGSYVHGRQSLVPGCSQLLVGGRSPADHRPRGPRRRHALSDPRLHTDRRRSPNQPCLHRPDWRLTFVSAAASDPELISAECCAQFWRLHPPSGKFPGSHSWRRCCHHWNSHRRGGPLWTAPTPTQHHHRRQGTFHSGPGCRNASSPTLASCFVHIPRYRQ